MKFVLEVKESKAATLLALLNDLPYVKTKPLTPYKAKILEDIKDSVDEMNQVLSGKLEARNADDLLKPNLTQSTKSALMKDWLTDDEDLAWKNL